MTTTDLDVVPSAQTSADPVALTKPRRTRALMLPDRKSEHHEAKRLLAGFFNQDAAVRAEWEGLFPGKQLRVIANLLLDYVPAFLPAFRELPPPPAILEECRKVLQNAAPDIKGYRRNNLSQFQRNQRANRAAK